MPQIDGSIDHSPWQINDLFIVLFKWILDPRILGSHESGEQGLVT